MLIKPLESPRMVFHALNYARHELPVFPVYEPFCDACTCGPDCGSPGKHPRTKNGVKDSTTDPAKIRKWWEQWPEANIGIATGNLIVIDIDKHKGGFESFEKLKAECGPLPETWTADTGGGGQHYLFRRNGADVTNKTGIAPGIDIKTVGGYIVTTPSLHVSGRRYQWSPNSSRTLADLPGSWLDRISGNGGNGHKSRFDTAGALAGVPEGKRDETLFKLACKLRNADVPFSEALDTVLKSAARCNPPLPADLAREKVEWAYRTYTPQPERAPKNNGVTTEDFYAYMPLHRYIHAPSGEIWPASSVDVRLTVKNADGKPVRASTHIDVNRPVEQITWAPGLPKIVRNRIICEGGWIDHSGCSVFNFYRQPRIIPGNPDKAGPWLDHVHKVYGDDSEHIICWLAHRVQRPQEKINHALVMGGLQGIGKDTILEPVKYAIGPWNFIEVSPTHMLGRFNGYLKAVILRINEARDLGDVDRFKFYDHLKAYTAAPPDVLRCDEKHLREYYLPNLCGVIVTTNHKTDGIYLPADDRRHFVAWSDLKKDDFTQDYWNRLYRWYADEGNGHVAAYLQAYDLSDFDPKEPPPKTEAFWAIVDASTAPEDSELADVIDTLGNPPAFTIATIVSNTHDQEFAEWLKDRRNARQIPHRLEAAGYVPVRCQTTTDGRWKLQGKRQNIYVKKNLCLRDRIREAVELTRRP